MRASTTNTDGFHDCQRGNWGPFDVGGYSCGLIIAACARNSSGKVYLIANR